MRGKKGDPHLDPEDPPRPRANKRRGHGTYANDRPPILGVICRESGEQRYQVCEHADRPTCHAFLLHNLPADAAILYTDEWSAYNRLPIPHATVNHSQHEWARDDDGDGIREVHCNTCEGCGTGLRNFLRTFRGVHKAYLAQYIATYETMQRARVISPAVVYSMTRRRLPHSGDS